MLGWSTMRCVDLILPMGSCQKWIYVVDFTYRELILWSDFCFEVKQTNWFSGLFIYR